MRSRVEVWWQRIPPGCHERIEAVGGPLNPFPGLRVVMVGPVPPPAGGMAAQTSQLAELLGSEGASVRIVASNALCRPKFVRRVPGVRAVFRFLPFTIRVWRALASADVVHVMANSGWSWHLIAAPTIWLARARRVPAIVNYRGGLAAEFLRRRGRVVAASVARARLLVVPSRFLEAIFARHGMRTEVIANIVDLERFHPANRDARSNPHVLVARNLEPIYGIDTALRAFARVHAEVPNARMTIAGSGPDHDRLLALRAELGLAGVVEFAGQLDREGIAERYRLATVALNPSRADNMPNSVLEAMASRVPIVSTNVGGVPYILQDGATGLLVQPDDPGAMATALLRLFRSAEIAKHLADAAFAEVQRYSWPRLRERWAGAYRAALVENREPR